MKILYLANNRSARDVLEWLVHAGEDIAALVVHPTGNSKWRDEIVRTANLDPARIFDGSRLHDSSVMDAIRETRPDIGISVSFGYILRQEFLGILPHGCINLHTSFLPYNRGANPNVWSIVENTPAGVTLHYVDAGVDTGDVIARRRVEVSPADTGETLYRRLERESIVLFKEVWPTVRAGLADRAPQVPNQHTSHRVRDLEAIDKIYPDRTYKAQQLIDIIRARTFPPHRGAYFECDGKKYYLSLEIVEDAAGN